MVGVRTLIGGEGSSLVKILGAIRFQIMDQCLDYCRFLALLRL